MSDEGLGSSVCFRFSLYLCLSCTHIVTVFFILLLRLLRFDSCFPICFVHDASVLVHASHFVECCICAVLRGQFDVLLKPVRMLCAVFFFSISVVSVHLMYLSLTHCDQAPPIQPYISCQQSIRNVSVRTDERFLFTSQ